MNKKIIITIVVIVVIYIAYRMYKEKKYEELHAKLREQMRTGSASTDFPVFLHPDGQIIKD